MAWQNPKTDWKAGDIPTAFDFNRIEGNIQELENTKETPSGAQAKANAALNSAKAYTDQKVDSVANNLAAHLADTTTDAHLPKNVGFRIYADDEIIPTLPDGVVALIYKK